jgi:hypothetical protein
VLDHVFYLFIHFPLYIHGLSVCAGTSPDPRIFCIRFVANFVRFIFRRNPSRFPFLLLFFCHRDSVYHSHIPTVARANPHLTVVCTSNPTHNTVRRPLRHAKDLQHTRTYPNVSTTSPRHLSEDNATLTTTCKPLSPRPLFVLIHASACYSKPILGRRAWLGQAPGHVVGL